MAKKRRVTRKHRPMSELSRRKPTRTRRRKHTRGKGMLSEIMNPATATDSAKATLSGAVGGYVAGYLDEPTATMTPLARASVFLGSSFLLSAILKMPNLGSGVAGAYGLLLNRKMQGLSEDFTPYEYADNLEEEPEYLDESGNPMFLADDGQFYYLEEDNDDNENLSANFLADYMPGYAPTY